MLVEIAHKTMFQPVAIPQGESGHINGASIVRGGMTAAETTALAHAGWIACHLGVGSFDAVRLTEFGARMIAPNGLAGVEINALLQDARKAAGLSHAMRLQLQSEARYAFAPLNTTDPAKVEEHVKLDDVATCALVETAHKILHHGVEPAGRGFRGAETFDYWNDYAAQKLISEKLIAFTSGDKGTWLVTLPPRGRDWLVHNGLDPAALDDGDLFHARKGEAPAEGRAYVSAFLSPAAAPAADLGPKARERAPAAGLTTFTRHALTDAAPARFRIDGLEYQVGDGWVVIKADELAKLEGGQ
jgi:hypothetical protein